MRFASLFCLSLLVACGDTLAPSSPLDGGAGLDAGTPSADATVAADASATPDADVLTDAGADDAGTADAGVTCPDGTERQGEACVDIDECQTDNGGCGDPERWRCENQQAQAPLHLDRSGRPAPAAPGCRGLRDGRAHHLRR